MNKKEENDFDSFLSKVEEIGKNFLLSHYVGKSPNSLATTQHI